MKKIATRESYGNALKELGAEHDDLIVFDAAAVPVFHEEEGHTGDWQEVLYLQLMGHHRQRTIYSEATI